MFYLASSVFSRSDATEEKPLSRSVRPEETTARRVAMFRLLFLRYSDFQLKLSHILV